MIYKIQNVDGNGVLANKQKIMVIIKNIILKGPFFTQKVSENKNSQKINC